MNTYEKAIHESLESIQSAPSEALRSRVMRSIAGELELPRMFTRRFPLRAAVITAVIAGLILTTAATFGNEIIGVVRRFVFGDSTATQIVYASELALGSWGVMNRSDLDGAFDYPVGLFGTLEEARQAAPFYIREPAYLPQSVTGLRSVGVWRVESPNSPWMHFVTLNYDIPFEIDGISGTSLLTLKQTYGGPDAYIAVNTVFPIEVVMVGNNEAVLIVDDGRALYAEGDKYREPSN